MTSNFILIAHILLLIHAFDIIICTYVCTYVHACIIKENDLAKTLHQNYYNSVILHNTWHVAHMCTFYSNVTLIIVAVECS